MRVRYRHRESMHNYNIMVELDINLPLLLIIIRVPKTCLCTTAWGPELVDYVLTSRNSLQPLILYIKYLP